MKSWRVDLVAAFLSAWVHALGWRSLRVVRASTGSVYLHLARGTARAVLRVADHPPRRSLPWRVLWLRVPSLALSLSAVPAFLSLIAARASSPRAVPASSPAC